MEQGFYANFDALVYHNDPCETPSLNYSTAAEIIKRDPWHGWKKHPRLGGSKWLPTKEMDEGSIVHALLLGQPLDGLVSIISADNYKKKATQAKKKEEQEAGKLVILEKRFDELRSGLPFIRANLDAAGVHLWEGDTEATVVWESECECRTRIDHISDDRLLITDLKCSDDPDVDRLERHIIEMCYDVQGAAEIEAIETVFPETVGRIEFRDVFIWTRDPWFVIAATHSESMLDLGRQRWQRAKREWIQAMKTGIWRGPPNKVTVCAPGWALTKELGERA